MNRRCITTIAVFISCIVVLPLLADEIHDAAREGDLEKVQSILEKNPGLLMAQDNTGMTRLDVASGGGQADIVALLRQKGS
jgi:hypothetical protein